ncbi:MAG: 3-oxoadipate CoA-transferase subunit B [Promethearchaeota archaeon]|nr:MAG: 3-oxoadipate CoA-transferase subunit B [Candidatus Lokiarchaeota archaeon]
MKYRRVELMVLAASKEIKDGEVCIIGQGIPMTAGAIAKRNHAPNSIILTEAGMVDVEIFQNLEDVADPGSTKGFSYSCDLFDVFTTIVNRGYADLCMLGAAQIDKYGNINTTVVGDYRIKSRSDMKLPGSGGANEFAGHCKRTAYTVVGGKFVKELDYLTSPGWLEGGDSRREAGLPGGPSTVFSRYGVFRFEDDTKEMYLSALFPDTTIKDVEEIIPWDLKTAEDLGEEIKRLDPPTKQQLQFMREFEPFLGISGHEGRILQVRSLPGYYAKHKKDN